MIRVGGVVLCGGDSTRMGRPKAWLTVGTETMLQRVVRLVGEAVGPVVVVAAPEQQTPPLPASVEMVRDQTPGLGPLHGFACGLHALSGRVEAVYLSGCDAPLLKPTFVQRMIGLLGEHAACVPHDGVRFYPLSAVYRIDALAAARQRIEAKRTRLLDLFDVLPTRVVPVDALRDVDAELDSLRNVNTPQEYDSVRSQLETKSLTV
jgi:molybdopterin-guanine dinucleotide biosynthesis protein A